MSFRVVTYNLLAQPLASHHVGEPSALEEEARFARTVELLSAEIDRASTICLQELTRTWADRLRVVFADRGYTLVASNYGGSSSDYMGVGIAYPPGLRLRKVLVSRIADGLQTSAPNRPKKSWVAAVVTAVIAVAMTMTVATYAIYMGAGLGLMAFAFGLFLTALMIVAAVKGTDYLANHPKPVDVWAEALRRYNTLVALHLEGEGGHSYCVATYRMPCVFWSEPVMTLHARAAAGAAGAFARTQEAPLVLAGDWNIRPGTAPYRLLVEGEQPVLKSAYLEHTGAEPEFTNYASIRRKTEPFIDTLDYIFYRGDITVRDVNVLPGIEGFCGPIPTPQHPSDHLMLGAEFVFDK